MGVSSVDDRAHDGGEYHAAGDGGDEERAAAFGVAA